VEATREARSAKRRIDVGSEVRFLRLMQQQGKKVRHLEQRLVLIERKVYREDEAA
jgi:phage gp16-like protein